MTPGLKRQGEGVLTGMWKELMLQNRVFQNDSSSRSQCRGSWGSKYPHFSFLPSPSLLQVTPIGKIQQKPESKGSISHWSELVHVLYHLGVCYYAANNKNLACQLGFYVFQITLVQKGAVWGFYSRSDMSSWTQASSSFLFCHPLPVAPKVAGWLLYLQPSHLYSSQDKCKKERDFLLGSFCLFVLGVMPSLKTTTYISLARKESHG